MREMIWPIIGLLLVSCRSEQASTNNAAATSERASIDQQAITAQTVRDNLARLAPAPTVTSAPTFSGFECTEDCSGHEAGYQWAEDHSITDPDDCGGNSESFIEGCIAYASEQGDEDDREFDDYYATRY